MERELSTGGTFALQTTNTQATRSTAPLSKDYIYTNITNTPSPLQTLRTFHKALSYNNTQRPPLLPEKNRPHTRIKNKYHYICVIHKKKDLPIQANLRERLTDIRLTTLSSEEDLSNNKLYETV